LAHTGIYRLPRIIDLLRTGGELSVIYTARRKSSPRLTIPISTASLSEIKFAPIGELVLYYPLAGLPHNLCENYRPAGGDLLLDVAALLPTVVGLGGRPSGLVYSREGPTHSDAFLKTFLQPRSVSCRRASLVMSRIRRSTMAGLVAIYKSRLTLKRSKNLISGRAIPPAKKMP